MTTIKDVAALAGVGLGTASRAMSGRGSVAPETRRRVEHAARSLNFQPLRRARAEAGGSIGLVVPSFTGNFYAPLLQAVDAELRAAGRHLLVAGGRSEGDERRRALDGIGFLLERRCAGVIVATNALSEADLHELRRRCPRVAFINRRAAGVERHCFDIDHELGGRLAARALLGRGHREIACIAGPADAADSRQRMAGFHAELARHGLAIPPARRAEGDFSFAGGFAATRRLLEQAPAGWTALFCANDVMAMAAISRLARAGLAVPRDVSVLGFDDSDIATYTTPQLTTVRIPVEQMAASACRFLLNECYGLAQPVAREFQPVLMWRDSVMPLEPVR
ncbi:MAG TPA: substrate-binding domain-containing protein [Burkholderiaceae bacterium]